MVDVRPARFQQATSKRDVSMEIPVGGDIGNEVHLVDQVLIFTSGEGKATIAGKDQVRDDFHYHNTINH